MRALAELVLWRAVGALHVAYVWSSDLLLALLDDVRRGRSP